MRHSAPIFLCLVGTLAVAAAASAREPKETIVVPPADGEGSLEISSADVGDDNNDILLSYNPIEPKPAGYFTNVRKSHNKIKSDSFTGTLEREQTFGDAKRSPNVREVLSPAESEQQKRGDSSPSANSERAKDIALNSREVRLVGPNQREVEMKDDLPTKFVVALENLQREATDVWGQVNEKLDKGWTEIKRSEVWGQVNEKLDKGWTDLKTMVEGVVTPSKAAGRKQN